MNQTSGTRRRTRAESRADTRAALLDAGARVFIERGFQGASIEAIAAEAGYTRGAFYSNFESKEELFAELMQERVYSRYRQMAERANAPERPSMRGERVEYERERVGLSALEILLVAMVLAAFIGFEVWFFFYSPSPIDQRSGRD